MKTVSKNTIFVHFQHPLLAIIALDDERLYVLCCLALLSNNHHHVHFHVKSGNFQISRISIVPLPKIMFEQSATKHTNTHPHTDLNN